MIFHLARRRRAPWSMQTARSTWDEWMTGDVVETLRRSVGEHATLAAKKRHQLKILNRFLVVLVLRPSSVGGPPVPPRLCWIVHHRAV